MDHSHSQNNSLFYAYKHGCVSSAKMITTARNTEAPWSMIQINGPFLLQTTCNAASAFLPFSTIQSKKQSLATRKDTPTTMTPTLSRYKNMKQRK